MKQDTNRENKNAAYSDDERLNITGEAPVTPFKIAEMIVCFAAAVIGLLYVYKALIPLSVLLPLFTACFIAVTVLRILDIRKTKVKKLSQYITTAVLGVLAAAMVLTTVFYFVR